jgi:biotin operon repressor
MEKAEREEVWQIIDHLVNQGFQVDQVLLGQDQRLHLTVSVPLLSKR